MALVPRPATTGPLEAPCVDASSVGPNPVTRLLQAEAQKPTILPSSSLKAADNPAMASVTACSIRSSRLASLSEATGFPFGEHPEQPDRDESPRRFWGRYHDQRWCGLLVPSGRRFLPFLRRSLPCVIPSAFTVCSPRTGLLTLTLERSGGPPTDRVGASRRCTTSGRHPPARGRRGAA